MSISWMSSVIDWDTCKIQYEVLGDSLDRVAITHGIPVESIRRIAQEENWTKLPPTASNLNEYLGEVLDSHRAKLSLAGLYRDMELFPQIFKAEQDLLTKITQAITFIDVGDIRAPAALRALGQGLNAIAERKVAGASEEEDTRVPTDNAWTVEIKKAEERIDKATEGVKLTSVGD
jgi:hypothetical protein